MLFIVSIQAQKILKVLLFGKLFNSEFVFWGKKKREREGEGLLSRRFPKQNKTNQ